MKHQNNIKEAIVLAGGLGTRLRSVIPDLPKCMAPVAGKPFLAYLIDYFVRQGIEKFIFALGYKSEDFEDFLRSKLAKADGGGGAGAVGSGVGAAGAGVDGAGGSVGHAEGPCDAGGPHYELSVEKEPLGTGGAIRLACGKASRQNVLVLNGDTFFGIGLHELSAFHDRQQADCTLCLKPMKNFDRYGVVELGQDQRIRDFREKQFYETGLINGGVYALNVPRFMEKPMPEKFSFEKDWLEKFHASQRMCGLVQDEYFIDIGIPEDYERAQRELPDALRMKEDSR
ncbi:MAG TPA: nucleotidyltransferase family protein [Puia sp.]|nr:nucleotidyltransferase family protein [Puia sp.]